MIAIIIIQVTLCIAVIISIKGLRKLISSDYKLNIDAYYKEKLEQFKKDAEKQTDGLRSYYWELDRLVNSEEFIDRVVERIRKKQL